MTAVGVVVKKKWVDGKMKWVDGRTRSGFSGGSERKLTILA